MMVINVRQGQLGDGDLQDSRKIGHHEVGEVLGEEVVGGRREQHEPP